MKMTVQDLYDYLSDLLDNDEEAGQMEVRMAQQPNYPFEYSIQGITGPIGGSEGEEEDEEEDEEFGFKECIVPYGTKDGEKVIYLLEGRQLGYASKSLWERNEM